MTDIIDDKTLEEVRKLLNELQNPVELVFFSQTPACDTCRQQAEILQLLNGLSDQLKLTTYDLIEDAEQARSYQVSKVPATCVIGAQDYGIRFYGITAGYEFSSLIEDILMVASGESGLDPEVEALSELIDQPTQLEVMVTLSCPYCPKMVRVAHQLAMANPNIRGDMIDAAEFPQLVQRYEVSGVPRTVINGGAGIEGALPAPQALLEILKHVNPPVYDKLEAQMREARGERHVSQPDPQHLYDSLIVGAGPAAMTAAIYAARKALDVLVIGQHVGGQITNTASIENWPGIPEISGDQLAGLMRNHAESYQIAEQLNTEVSRIEKSPQGFIVSTSNDERFQAKSVIYCAGKQYRTLGVPGEQRFLGHGIAFCATCDAPLFRDKRVAVVGGGNSAFTAARDLLNYAREIHIINVLPDFQADPVLQEEVGQSPLVTLHPSTHVREFLGNDRLSGIRLEHDSGNDRQDLAVEGVFLEIGLQPNTGPVADLLQLNSADEIPVQRDQSTEVDGLFAAGDCTDETEKQIVIAAAAGARAALAVDRYLQQS
ncbi:MAG: FAD-dependent oxidoreductase [Chromatiales bacterium]|jgi:alkyl hydroperoxide reductase subunit F